MKRALIIALGILAITWAGVNTEIDYGVCVNEEQDGFTFNDDPEYNYISYRNTDARPGERVLSVFFLNPTNLAPDDYIYRNDWIIGR